MKKLAVFLRPYRKECVFSPLFKLFEAILELFVPLVMARIIDVGIADADKDYVVRMCLVMIGLGALGLVAAITAQYFAAKAAVGFAAGVRGSLFAKLQSLSYRQIDRMGTSAMITRMTSDVNQMQTGVNMTLRLLLRSPFVVLGAMVMAFTIDWQAALIFAAVIPLLYVAVWLIMKVTLPGYRNVQKRLDAVLRRTRENLSGVRVIRAFNRQDAETESFNCENDALFSSQVRVGNVSALTNPLTYILINLGIVVLLWVGALRIDNGTLTQGMVVALVNYMSQILVELIKFANLVTTVTKALASARRVSEAFGMVSDQDNGTETEIPASDEIIRFDRVSLRYYENAEKALDSLSFSVRRGQTVGIIGGTGSGKSSLVQLIPRFYDATEGTVFYCGKVVREYELNTLRSKIGVVPQKAVLFRGTIRENLIFGGEAKSDEELFAALRAAQADQLVSERPLALDDVVEQGGRNFSGGQKQRLTIARALVRRPEILILDDSSSALDYATEAALRRSLRELSFSPTVFVVSQRASSVRYADFIIVMDEGKAVGIGTHEQLLETCSVYREIYESQTERSDEK